MPKPPIIIKKTEFKNYEEHDRYMDEIKKKTTMSAIRNTRDKMNAQSSGMHIGWVKALNYSNDQDRIERAKKRGK